MAGVITIDHNSRKVIMEIQFAEKRVRTGIRQGMMIEGKEHVRFTKNIIKDRRSKTGEVMDYTKTGRIKKVGGFEKRRSAPGEAPAYETGQLYKSIAYKVRSYNEMEFGDQVEYGKFLEEGTEKMMPRPHLRRAVEKRKSRFLITINQQVDKAIKKRGL